MTVDVEEEFDWSEPFSRTGHRLDTIAALRDAHRRLVDGGALVDYLIDWPVADDPRLPEQLGEAVAKGTARVGAQLHPWVNPPFVEPVGVRNSFLANLCPEIADAKLSALTKRITTAVGRSPRVFRAGRYGLGSAHLAMLRTHGYRIDTSVRSGFGYQRAHGPDYRQMPPWPWAIGSGVTELPPTTLFLGLLPKIGRVAERLYHRVAVPNSLTAAVLARARIVERVPLTPEGVPADRACAAIDAALALELPVLNLSFHSPSLAPGNTPYVRDRTDLSAFWRWWDIVLGHLARREVKGLVCEDAASRLVPACQSFAPGANASVRTSGL